MVLSACLACCYAMYVLSEHNDCFLLECISIFLLVKLFFFVLYIVYLYHFIFCGTMYSFYCAIYLLGHKFQIITNFRWFFSSSSRGNIFSYYRNCFILRWNMVWKCYSRQICTSDRCTGLFQNQVSLPN